MTRLSLLPESRQPPMQSLSPEELDRPDSPIDRLAGSREQADPLCCRADWLFSWHDSFSPHRPLVLRGSEEGLVAFARNHYPNLGPVLEPLEAHWFFGCPLLGPDPLPLLDRVRREEAGHALLVSGLLPGSPLMEGVLGLMAETPVFRLEPLSVRSASLAGGVDGFLSRRGAKLRRGLRIAEKRGRDSGLRFERRVPASEAEADGIYDRMLAVEAKSWKGLDACGMAEPPSRDFYRFLLRRLSRAARGRVIFAVEGDTDVGFIFGQVADGRYRGQQFSYVQERAEASIGNLLQLAQVRWLCEEGAAWYDLGSTMEYKTHWAEEERVAETLLFVPPD